MLRFAIIGRPNVGKSTLFNRLLGKKRAIVHDAPGVTRDWQEYTCTLGTQTVLLYDTPGVNTLWSSPHVSHITAFLWVLDAQQGLTPCDREIAIMLRKQPIPVLIIANKSENKKDQLAVTSDILSVGYNNYVFISALHDMGMGTLQNKLLSYVSQNVPEDVTVPKINNLTDNTISVVVLGQPNVGKSTFVNYFLGYERMRTGPEAGITSDAVSTTRMWKNYQITITDTAGMRRQSAVKNMIEKLSCQESYRALVFCHVTVLLIDATQPLMQQDRTLMEKIEQEGRALVIGLNKWDMVPAHERKSHPFHHDSLLQRHLTIPLSSVTGWGMDTLWNAVLETYREWNQRINTGQLNRWLEKKIAAHTPPLTSRGHRVKMKYITQIKTRPPTFIINGYSVKDLPESYVQYLKKGLCHDFSFPCVRIMMKNASNPYDKK